MHALQIVDVTLATCLRHTRSTSEVVALAERLASDGQLDVLDVGDLPTSPERLVCIQQIAREAEDVAIACRAPMHQPSIDAAWAAMREAERPVLQLVTSLATEHQAHRPADHHNVILHLVRATVGYARMRGPVTSLVQDAASSEPDRLIQVVEAAITAGAETVVLADTAGQASPHKYGALFGLVRERVRGSERIVLGVHTHHRCGMATAKTMAAIKAGARLITIEDEQEGTGDHPTLAEIERIIHARPDGFGQLFLSL